MAEGHVYICTHDFEAEHADELQLQAGDDVQLVPNRAALADRDTWWTGRNLRTGKTGLFPRGFVHFGQPASTSTPTAGTDTDTVLPPPPPTGFGDLARLAPQAVVVVTSSDDGSPPAPNPAGASGPAAVAAHLAVPRVRRVLVQESPSARRRGSGSSLLSEGDDIVSNVDVDGDDDRNGTDSSSARRSPHIFIPPPPLFGPSAGEAGAGTAAAPEALPAAPPPPAGFGVSLGPRSSPTAALPRPLSFLLDIRPPVVPPPPLFGDASPAPAASPSPVDSGSNYVSGASSSPDPPSPQPAANVGSSRTSRASLTEAEKMVYGFGPDDDGEGSDSDAWQTPAEEASDHHSSDGSSAGGEPGDARPAPPPPARAASTKQTLRNSQVPMIVQRHQAAQHVAAPAGAPQPAAAGQAWRVSALDAAAFQGLPTPTINAEALPAAARDPTLNRDAAILPMPRSRVHLAPTRDNGEGYINANLVSGVGQASGPQYIAAMSPVPRTMLPFWRMVWQEGVHSIVAAAELVAGDTPDCAPYWPQLERQALRIGPFCVSCLSRQPSPTFVHTVLAVANEDTGDSRRVSHFHIPDWPEAAVPRAPSGALKPDAVLDVIGATWAAPHASAGPLLIHCKTGVGPTGVLICADRCFRRLEQDGQADTLAEIAAVRRDRGPMVQSVAQYEMLQAACLEYARRRGHAAMDSTGSGEGRAEAALYGKLADDTSDVAWTPKGPRVIRFASRESSASALPPMDQRTATPLRREAGAGAAKTGVTQVDRNNLQARRVQLDRGPSGFGFSINGEDPVFVTTVRPGGPSDKGRQGLLPGDIVLKINATPCVHGPRSRVVSLIKATEAGQQLSLVVCRPPAPDEGKAAAARESLPLALTTFTAQEVDGSHHLGPSSYGADIQPIPMVKETSFSAKPPAGSQSTAPPALSRPESCSAFESGLEAFLGPGAPSSAPEEGVVQLRQKDDAASRAQSTVFESMPRGYRKKQLQAMKHLSDYTLADLAGADISGWLLKLCGRHRLFRKWKRRWFVVKGNRLFYFHSRLPGAQPSFYCSLAGCTVAKVPESQARKANVLRIDNVYPKTLTLAPHDQLELGLWMDELNKARMLDDGAHRVERRVAELKKQAALAPAAPSAPAPPKQTLVLSANGNGSGNDVYGLTGNGSDEQHREAALKLSTFAVPLVTKGGLRSQRQSQDSLSSAETDFSVTMKALVNAMGAASGPVPPPADGPDTHTQHRVEERTPSAVTPEPAKGAGPIRDIFDTLAFEPAGRNAVHTEYQGAQATSTC